MILHKNARGSVAIVCLATLTVAIMIVAAVASESVARLVQTRRSVDYDQALCIAEAGADFGVTLLKSSPSYGGTVAPIPYGDGTFEVTISDASGGKLITSVGRLENGISATVQVRTSTDTHMTFPDGCLVSNEDITCTGNASTNTLPADQHQASARANGNFVGTGNMIIDGSVAAHGSVTLNGNACIYDPDYPEGHSGAPEISFPSPAEHDAWRDELISEAQAGSIIPGINLAGHQNLTLTPPVYINGSLKLSGQSTVTIAGEGVVYVAGDIQFTGQTSIVNRGILAAGGVVQQTGNASYRVTGTCSRVGMVSFAENSEALQLVGNSSVQLMGLMYAAKGGIKVTGNGTFYGALVAAGEGANGGIRITGNGTIYYPADLLANNELVPGGFAIKSWLEL